MVKQTGNPDEAARVCDKLLRWFERFKHYLPA